MPVVYPVDADLAMIGRRVRTQNKPSCRFTTAYGDYNHSDKPGRIGIVTGIGSGCKDHPYFVSFTDRSHSIVAGSYFAAYELETQA